MSDDAPEIDVTELARRHADGAYVLDVRQPDEFAFAKIEGAKLIPLGELMGRKDEIDETRNTVVLCKMGGRSARAIEFLEHSGFKGSLSNLVGGITAWSNEIDPSVLKY